MAARVLKWCNLQFSHTPNMKNIPLNERIIFALDVAHPDDAKQWVKQLDEIGRAHV